jgi:hypothetical protein
MNTAYRILLVIAFTTNQVSENFFTESLVPPTSLFDFEVRYFLFISLILRILQEDVFTINK